MTTATAASPTPRATAIVESVRTESGSIIFCNFSSSSMLDDVPELPTSVTSHESRDSRSKYPESAIELFIS